jgi:hypothetical protein
MVRHRSCHPRTPICFGIGVLQNRFNYLILLVGAPRFELGTPSPPGSCGAWNCLWNFANGVSFRPSAINGIGPVLQTLCAALELHDRSVGQ